MVQLTHHALKSFECFRCRPISSANRWNVKLSTIFVVSHERSLHHQSTEKYSKNKTEKKVFPRKWAVHEIHTREQCVMVIIAIYLWREMAFSSFRVVYSHGEVIKLKRVRDKRINSFSHCLYLLAYNNYSRLLTWTICEHECCTGVSRNLTSLLSFYNIIRISKIFRTRYFPNYVKVKRENFAFIQ